MSVFRLFACLMLLTITGVFAQETVHTVRRGETVYALARRYGVAVQEILTLNGISDPTRVREGARLRIPRTGPSASGGQTTGSGQPAGSGRTTESGQAATGEQETVRADAPRYIAYQAVRGDSFYALARRYGTTAEAIREASGLAPDHVLKVGDRLRIPDTAPPAVSGTVPANGGAGSGRQNPPRATSPARTVDASVVWPVAAREVAYMTGNMNGVVLLGERAEPVRSLMEGTVISAGPYRGMGKVAVVQVQGGYIYVYGGCENLSVREGDRVAPGTELGRLGIDGISSKPELFFLVYRNNTPVDPAIAPRS